MVLTATLLGSSGTLAAADDKKTYAGYADYDLYGKYEGYGPVERYLIGNNPPVPEPIGPRVLRDIPAIGDTMKRWPAFFRDLEADIHFRTAYRNSRGSGGPCTPAGCPDDVRQEAWALGGWLGLQSGWLLDTFRIGATGYFSEPGYAPESRDGTNLLAPGQEGIEVLGEAYAQLRYKEYALLTGYRQRVDQRFVNPQDNRMIPNTFEGATLTGTVGPVDYALGYLTAIKTRNSDTFINMAKAVRRGIRCSGRQHRREVRSAWWAPPSSRSSRSFPSRSSEASSSSSARCGSGSTMSSIAGRSKASADSRSTGSSSAPSAPCRSARSAAISVP